MKTSKQVRKKGNPSADKNQTESSVPAPAPAGRSAPSHAISGLGHVLTPQDVIVCCGLDRLEIAINRVCALLSFQEALLQRFNDRIHEMAEGLPGDVETMDGITDLTRILKPELVTSLAIVRKLQSELIYGKPSTRASTA